MDKDFDSLIYLGVAFGLVGFVLLMFSEVGPTSYEKLAERATKCPQTLQNNVLSNLSGWEYISLRSDCGVEERRNERIAAMEKLAETANKLSLSSQQ